MNHSMVKTQVHCLYAQAYGCVTMVKIKKIGYSISLDCTNIHVKKYIAGCV